MNLFLLGGYSNSRNGSPKLPAGLPPKTTPKESVARPSSPAASVASIKSAGKEELMLFKKSHQNSSRRPSNSTSSTGSGSANSDKEQPNITNGNPRTLNFQPDGTKAKPLQGLRAMDTTQKKRIAAILSRNKQ